MTVQPAQLPSGVLDLRVGKPGKIQRGELMADLDVHTMGHPRFDDRRCRERLQRLARSDTGRDQHGVRLLLQQRARHHRPGVQQHQRTIEDQVDQGRGFVLFVSGAQLFYIVLHRQPRHADTRDDPQWPGQWQVRHHCTEQQPAPRDQRLPTLFCVGHGLPVGQLTECSRHVKVQVMHEVLAQGEGAQRRCTRDQGK